MQEKTKKSSSNQNAWHFLKFSEEKVSKISNYYNISDFLSKFISLKEDLSIENILSFLNPKIENTIPDPMKMKDMKKAVDVFLDTIKRKAKIAIFADYDVDGACCAAFLDRFLIELGYSEDNFIIYVPNRFNEGYGPNSNAMKSFYDSGAELVITVDCGIVAFEPLEYATSLGLKVIVLDHHKSADTFPNVSAVVNPNRHDDGMLDYLCGAGVVFMFCVAVYKLFSTDIKKRNTLKSFLIKNLDIVCLATICDVVPLCGLNRSIVKTGLKIINSKNTNTGIAAMIEATGLEGRNINEKSIGFSIGPLINAGGRIGESALGAKLLACKNDKDALKLAVHLYNLNQQRKEIELKMTESAIQCIDENLASKEESSFVMFYSEDMHEGVMGIVASRVSERYSKLSIIGSFCNNEDSESYCKFSCRSVKHVNIGKIVLEMVEKGLALKGGGHEFAAGFTSRAADLDGVELFLKERVGEMMDGVNTDKSFDIHYEMQLSSINDNLKKDLSQLEPFGVKNKEPIFLIRRLKVIALKKVKKHFFLTFRCEYTKTFIDANCFGAEGTKLGDMLDRLMNKVVDVICKVEYSDWGGREKRKIHIIDVKDFFVESDY